LKLRMLTSAGNAAFHTWLQERAVGDLPPPQLRDGDELTTEVLDVEVDLGRSFASRFEFGRYMAEVLRGQNSRVVLSNRYDGLWNWLTVVYFEQFGRKVSKPWHYLITRRGHSGSLAYRPRPDFVRDVLEARSTLDGDAQR
jgi:hypothetical protein